MKPKKTDRFICTEISGGAFDTVQCRVLVDRKTGVNYLFTTSGYSGGLTALRDPDGEVVVTPVSSYDDDDEDEEE